MPARASAVPECEIEEEAAAPTVRTLEEGVRVIVVDEDHVTRTALARALMARGVELVIASEHLDEVDDKLLLEEGPHVLYCDLDEAGAAGRLFELVQLFSDLAIVARAKQATGARVMLELMHAKTFEVLPLRPKTTDAVAVVLSLARAVAASIALAKRAMH